MKLRSQDLLAASRMNGYYAGFQYHMMPRHSNINNNYKNSINNSAMRRTISMYKLNSSPQKPDQYRNGSMSHTPPSTPNGRRNRQGSSRRIARASDDNGLKRGRMQAAYELSQDLQDKQQEVLERRYGGRVRARNAALTIQRAFRRYAMVQKFHTITQSMKAENRLSRRFQLSELEQMPWINNNKDNTKAHQQQQNYQQIGSSERNRPPKPVRSVSLRGEKRDDTLETSDKINYLQHNYSYNEDLMTTSAPSCPLHHDVIVNQPDLLQRDIAVRRTIATSPSKQKRSKPDVPKRTSSINSNESRGSSNRRPVDIRARVVPTHQRKISDPGEMYRKHLIPTVDMSCSLNSDPTQWSTQSQGARVNLLEQQMTNSQAAYYEPRTAHFDPNHSSNLGHNKTDSISLSSSSESSLCATSDELRNSSTEPSPIWSRKPSQPTVDSRLTNICENEVSMLQTPVLRTSADRISSRTSETVRKRQYRVGLNLFNKKPEKGILYLIRRGFLYNTPQTVAQFLVTRKGLSKQLIGEYLGNLQNPFNMAVLDCFAKELDLYGLQIDVALRKFQSHFRMPGEAQKIERLMEVFAHRYCDCNPDVVKILRNADTVFILAFAVIMLNTDLHTPNIKPERKMKLEDFIKNLRGIDDGMDINKEMLTGIYERIRDSEFRPGADHVTQVMKVQQTIVGKKPSLALPHRRLVCYCRLYEVSDPSRKERPGVHQREVFLFNDIIVITKILSKKKNAVTYSYRDSFPLCGMSVQLFQTSNYQFGMKLSQKVDGKSLVTFNARNEHDRSKFVEDLRESVAEMDELESIRIETELEKQRVSRIRSSENRDSGVADVEDMKKEEGGLKRSALNNSLISIHDAAAEKPQRRGSIGSLDSGMSVSFQSSSTSSVSRDGSPQNVKQKPTAPQLQHQASFLAMFRVKGKKDEVTVES